MNSSLECLFQRKGTQKKAPIVSVLINCNLGPAFTWKLELLHPTLVQPLDSIFNISVTFAFMNIFVCVCVCELN